MTDRISPTTKIFAGDKGTGWSGSEWDYNGQSTIFNGTLTDEEQGQFAVKIPYYVFSDSIAATHHVCATISIPSKTSFLIGGRIWAATAICNSAAGGGTFNDIQLRNAAWSIAAGNNRTTCVSMSFSVDSNEDPCDHCYFGFSYTSSSGKESEAFQFYVSYRWDMEVVGITPPV